MNQTIKKRIEEINNGIVPEGYEKTSFGIFPCDWEITRIKSIAYLNKQKFNPQENKDNLVCIELEHIVPERGVLNGNTYAQNKHSLKNTFCKGDILFGKLRPYLGKYYHADQKGVCSTEIWVIRNNNTIDNNFLFQLVKGKRFIQSAQDSAFGTKMPRAEWQKVEKEKFVIPTSFREQSRIAEILMQWDKAIELQEKLIEAYQKSKKYYLKKMFPKKGSNIPEIRFPGFTAPWEQRKAKELCSICTGKSNTQDQVVDGKYPFYIRSNVPVRSNKYLYDCEAVITIGDGNIGKVFYYVNEKFDLHQRCYKMADFRDVWGKYFYYYFSTNFYDRAIQMTAKATVDSVRLEMISEMDIQKPTQIAEQKRISLYFENLDNLITLHKQKRDKLVKQRKAMQQYLLTGIVRV